ncbi:Hypothetical protein FKW44_011675, partial [Caligus rogercresseyi]
MQNLLKLISTGLISRTVDCKPIEEVQSDHSPLLATFNMPVKRHQRKQHWHLNTTLLDDTNTHCKIQNMMEGILS